MADVFDSRGVFDTGHKEPGFMNPAPRGPGTVTPYPHFAARHPFRWCEPSSPESGMQARSSPPCNKAPRISRLREPDFGFQIPDSPKKYISTIFENTHKSHGLRAACSGLRIPCKDTSAGRGVTWMMDVREWIEDNKVSKPG
jgi:hypothetical protein